VAAQANKGVFVLVQSKQDSAADRKYGADSHSAIETLLESALFKALRKKFPCIHYLDQSALRDMLDVERQRALLSSGDYSRLAESRLTRCRPDRARQGSKPGEARELTDRCLRSCLKWSTSGFYCTRRIHSRPPPGSPESFGMREMKGTAPKEAVGCSMATSQ
jgi:hypothetical protein